MSNLLILDSGHDEFVQGKEAPDKSLREWIFNNEMQYLIKKRTEDHNIKVVLTNPNPAKKDEIGLTKRCDLANSFYKNNGKPNSLFLSIHSNAYLLKDKNGHYINEFNNSRGTETFIASNASDNSKVAAKYVQDEIVKAIRLLDENSKDRGVKVEDYTVIFKTIMPSILCEYAFYSNKEDLKILKNNKNELVEATLKGICKYFGIEYKALEVHKEVPKVDGKLYKIQLGAYKEKANAEAKIKELKLKGIEAIIV